MNRTLHGLRHVCAATSALAILLACPFAAAQGAPAGVGPTAEARTHFERGVTFYNETDYAAALVEFKRAYALEPTWQVLFNVGQSDFQVHDYAGALVTLRQFLEEGQSDRVPDERRALVTSELADLANRVGHANIRSNLAGAEVTMDDAPLGVTPLSEPVLVSVGIRKLTATYAGRPPVEREVPVAAGETVDVHLDFPPVPAALTPPARPSSAALVLAPAQAAPSRSRGPAIAAFGLGLAGAGVGAIFGVLAVGDKSRLDGECAGKACQVGSQSNIDAVSRDATISTVGFGVMAVGVVVGVALWITSGGPATRTQDAVTEISPGLVSGTF